MTITILIPLLVCLVGLVLHALPIASPTAKEAARAMIWTGMLVTLLVVAQQRIHL